VVKRVKMVEWFERFEGLRGNGQLFGNIRQFDRLTADKLMSGAQNRRGR